MSPLPSLVLDDGAVLADGAVLDDDALARALAAALAARGLSQAEVARRLGVLPAVVSMGLRPWDHPERGRAVRASLAALVGFEAEPVVRLRRRVGQ